MATTDASNASRVVLVTGINGYIASHIGLILLQKGYTVRGTSRSASAEKKLVSEAFASHASRYQHCVVADLTVPGAFDEAVKGVHAIIHTASPVDFSLKTVDAFFIPAVKGVETICDSALRCAGPQLASFVLTSSVASVSDRWRHPPPEVYAYTEADWNTSGEAMARAEFSPQVAYGASKVAAEKTLWTWKEQHNPGFAVAVVNPAVVTGPPVNWPETPEALNETLMPIWTIWSGKAKTMPPQVGGAGYIDVRDVAALHVWCAENPQKSKGQRYLLANGKAPPQACADLLRKKYPQVSDRIVVGEPGKGYIQGTYWFPDTESSLVSNKAYQAMGVKRFRGYEESILDTVEAFEKRWPTLEATGTGV